MTYPITGRVASQDSGASIKPTKPLIAIKVTLFVKYMPCANVNSQRFLFMKYASESSTIKHPHLLDLVLQAE
jgi:hypothetical protein